MRLLRDSKSPPTFASFADATAAAGRGYAEPALINVVHEKTKRYRDALQTGVLELDAVDARVMLGVSLAAVTRQVRVLDFGGACGAHYFTARALLPDVQFHWRVIETTAMAAAAADLEDGSLAFFDDVTSAAANLPGIDLALSSGALHYASDPYAALTQLVDSEATVLLLTRLATTDGPEVYAIQRSTLAANGRGPMPPGMHDGEALYPMAVPNRAAVERIIRSRYRVRAQFQEDPAVSDLGGHTIRHLGYLASNEPHAMEQQT